MKIIKIFLIYYLEKITINWYNKLGGKYGKENTLKKLYYISESSFNKKN